jgi:predicted transcriptional regulator
MYIILKVRKLMDDNIEVLSKIVSKQEAKVLVYLATHGNATGMEIESKAGMRQPQMCIATSNLLKLGLITVTKEHEEGTKGRPRLRYSLDRKKTREWLATFLQVKESELKSFEDVVESWEKKLK